MSLVAIKTPDQVQEMRTQEEAKRRSNYERPKVVNYLAGYVKQCWESAKTSRFTLTNRMLDCHRRRRGMYSEAKLQQIRTARGSEIFMGITGSKCKAAKSWLMDLFSSDRPFTLDPTPVPDLPPDIQQRLVNEAMQGALELGVPPEMVKLLLEKHRDRLMDELKQEAEKRIARMEDKIHDTMIEGNWRKEFRDFIDDLVTYPFAALKGLEFKRQKTLIWVQQGGKFVPQRGHKIMPRARRVSPFRLYPSPAAKNTIEGHWTVEHQTFTRTDLALMRNSPGYNSEAIANVLLDYGIGGLKQWVWSEDEIHRLNGMGAHWIAKTDEIDGLLWSGSLMGKTLLEEGMDPKIITDPFDEYQMTLLVIGEHVVQALVNPDPAGKSDYYFASWEPIPGSLIGRALPEILSDCQDVCNAAARSLVDNMGYSSGPMAGVFFDELAPGQNVKSMHPRKMFFFKDRKAGASFPIHFFQPQSNATELINIYERFDKYADEITGLPKYAYGSDTGAGAAKTASGLSMLLNAASKNIKDTVRDIDGTIEHFTQKFYNFFMLTDKDDSIKGDANVKARGSEELMHKEQAQLRQQELLGITNNPTDMSIIGRTGRAEQLREVFKNGSLPEDRIIPDREEIIQQEQAMLAQPPQDAQQPVKKSN